MQNNTIPPVDDVLIDGDEVKNQQPLSFDDILFDEEKSSDDELSFDDILFDEEKSSDDELSFDDILFDEEPNKLDGISEVNLDLLDEYTKADLSDFDELYKKKTNDVVSEMEQMIPKMNQINKEITDLTIEFDKKYGGYKTDDGMYDLPEDMISQFNSDVEMFKNIQEEYRPTFEQYELLNKEYESNIFKHGFVYDEIKDRGTWLGALWTGASSSGIASLAGGVLKASIDLFGGVSPTAFAPAMSAAQTPEIREAESQMIEKRDEIKKSGLEEARRIKKVIEETLYENISLQTGGATKQYIEEGDFWVQAFNGLGASLPAMIGASATGGASFLAQSYDMADEAVAEMEGLSDIEKTSYKLLIAATVGTLERYGFRNILQNKAITKGVVGRILSKVPKITNKSGNVVSREFLKIVMSEANAANKLLAPIATRVTNVGGKILTGSAAEFETGYLQSFAENGINQLINASKGDELFDNMTIGEILKVGFRDGLMEAVGGGVMTASLMPFTSQNPTKKDFIKALPYISSVDLNSLQSYIDLNVKNKAISQKEGEEIFKAVREYKLDLNSIKDENVTINQAADIIELIRTRRGLEAKLEKSDDAFKGKIKDKIKEINEKIVGITESNEKKTAYKRDDKDISRDEIIEFFKTATIDDIKSGNIAITNDTELEDFLESVFKLKDGDVDGLAELKKDFFADESEINEIIDLINQDGDVDKKPAKRETPIETTAVTPVVNTLSENEGEILYNDKGERGEVRKTEGGKFEFVTDNNKIYELDGDNSIDNYGLTNRPPSGIDVLDRKNVKIDDKKYEIVSAQRKGDGWVVKAKEVVSDENGERKYGTTKRLTGQNAEIIAKDLSLQKIEPPKQKPKQKTVTKKKQVDKKPIKTKEDIDSKSEEELNQAIKEAEDFAKEYEEAIIEEVEGKISELDYLFLEHKGVEYAVRKYKSKGEDKYAMFEVKTGQPVRGKFRNELETVYKNERKKEEDRIIAEAALEAEKVKAETEDRILSLIDKAIEATSNKGRMFDATLGIPMFVLNSSLKIVRVAYKAGGNLSQAIANGIEYIKSIGYSIDDAKYSDYVKGNAERIKTQVDFHNKNGGSSITRDGKILTKGYSVSPYPDRTKIVKGKRITDEDISEFENNNSDILEEQPNAFVGTWYDSESESTYIDISIHEMNLEKATDIGRRFNQKAIYDLENNKEIDTGGTGEVIDARSQRVSEDGEVIDWGELMPIEAEDGISIMESPAYANLTEDGDGNFVFYHVGKKGYEKIDPKQPRSQATSREEASAIDKVGGVSMYYTNSSTSERMVTGDVKYMVKVPMDKVYDFNTDPEGFLAEAERRFREEYPSQAFTPNVQLAYITQVANENGYDMVVASWDGGSRAQTTKPMAHVDTEVRNGAAIEKRFDNDYYPNSDKGVVAVQPKSKEALLDSIYTKIWKVLNGIKDYSKAYHLSESFFRNRHTQDQITQIINDNNNIPQELKDEYREALTADSGRPMSMISKGAKRAADMAKSIKAVAKSIKLTFPNVAVVTGKNLDEVRANIKSELIARGIPERIAGNQAKNFTEVDAGKSFFYKGKPVLVAINEGVANTRTAAHEMWELILNQAFNNDTKKLKNFVNSIDKTLRRQGFNDIANKLNEFVNNYDGDVQFSEYMAELGGYITEGYFNFSALTSNQKTLIEKIRDLINKFAKAMIGGEVFLPDATAKNILEFMTVVSNKVARGKGIGDMLVKNELQGGLLDAGILLGEIGKDAVRSEFDVNYAYDLGDLADKLNIPDVQKVQDVLDKSGGAAVFVNSDGTMVGVSEMVGEVQGGWMYTYYKENQEKKSGFSASSDERVTSMYTLLKQIRDIRDADNPKSNGKPIAVFITIQNANTMFGEWYAGRYLMEGLDKAIRNGKLDVKKALKLIDPDLKVLDKKFKKEKDEEKQKTIGKKILNLQHLKEVLSDDNIKTHNGRVKLAENLSSSKYSFIFRSGLMDLLIKKTNRNVDEESINLIRPALMGEGVNYYNFMDMFMDRAILEVFKQNNYKTKSIGGVTLGGFYTDPYISYDEFFESRKNGIEHKMFNSSFKSTGETFRLDAAYDVNKMYPHMGFPNKYGYSFYNKANNTNINAKNATLRQKIEVSKWLIKNGKQELIINPFTSIAGAMYTSVVDEVYNEEMFESRSQKAEGEKDIKPKYPLRKLLGLPKDRKITVSERMALKEVLRKEAAGARTAKAAWNRIAKEITKEIKDLLGDGSITQKQALALLNKYKATNLFDPVSVDEFIDYSNNVFMNSTYDELVNQANKKAKSALKNIQTKIGIASELIPMLNSIFSINFEIIPDKSVAKWEELVNMFSGNNKVLMPDEIGYVELRANLLINEINNQLSAINELKMLFEEFDGKIKNKDGSVNYSDTINKMTEDGKITIDDAELMRRNKSMIVEKEVVEKMTKEEMQEALEEEKKQLLNVVDNISLPTLIFLPSRNERDLALKFLKSIKTDGVKELDNNDLKNLIKIIHNIKNGYLPSFTQILHEKIKANNISSVIAKATNGAKLKSIASVYYKLKSVFTRESHILEAIKSYPLSNIDQVFGDFKSKTIFNTLIRPLAEADMKFSSEYNKIDALLTKAQTAIEKSHGGKINSIVEAKFKMMAYMIQLEYDSNIGNVEVNPAIKYIDKTIEAIEGGNTNYGKRDADILREIKTKFAPNGQIDSEMIYKSLNQAEKNGIKVIQDVNANQLAEKAIYTSAIIRGEKINQRQNYTHINVIHDLEPSEIASDGRSLSDYNRSLLPSTRAKSLIKRSPGAKPIHFDVFSSAKRGARYTLLDYHMTDSIRTARRAMNKASKKSENKDVISAINKALETAIDNVLSSNFNRSSLADDVINLINKTGYRVMLGSVTRATAELASNLSYVMIQDPKAYSKGITLSKYAMGVDGMNIMNNVGSFQTTRLYPSGTLSGKLIDNNMIDQATLMKPSKARSDLAEKMNVIYNSTLKKAAVSTEVVADVLISTPDKMISRPLWFGSFANEFKFLTGNEIDLDKVANNDEAYMNAYANELKASAIKADDSTVKAVATDSRFSGILAGTIKPNQTWYKTLFNQFDRFMTRFMIYEYATARTGINAMIGNGQITKIKGVQLMAAVTTRMVMYTLLSKILVKDLLSLIFGEDEDESEKTFWQGLGQAFAGAFVSLILGRNFGNMTKSVINFGAENINKKYLDSLRDGDYNMFDDAITYSAIPTDPPAYGKSYSWEIVKNLTGAYAPFIKAADRAVTVISRNPKTKESAERRLKEMSTRMPLELLGTLGYVPLYADIRRITMKQLYKDIGKNKMSKTDLKKVNPKMYEMLYGKQDEIMKKIKKDLK